jgi:hypothetical protein
MYCVSWGSLCYVFCSEYFVGDIFAMFVTLASLYVCLCVRARLCNAQFSTLFQFGVSSLTRHLNVCEVIIYMYKARVEFTFLLY